METSNNDLNKGENSISRVPFRITSNIRRPRREEFDVKKVQLLDFCENAYSSGTTCANLNTMRTYKRTHTVMPQRYPVMNSNNRNVSLLYGQKQIGLPINFWQNGQSINLYRANSGICNQSFVRQSPVSRETFLFQPLGLRIEPLGNEGCLEGII